MIKNLKIGQSLVMSSTHYKLNFFSDPGHGWLEVPEALYKESKIVASQYSYYSPKKKMVYLEEDSDASKFMKAMAAMGITIETKDINVNGESNIRNMSRMPGH
jgi:major membrane immunogen (membrane-anchored lipoprotein)